jgi:hypothetical protein
MFTLQIYRKKGSLLCMHNSFILPFAFINIKFYKFAVDFKFKQ